MQISMFKISKVSNYEYQLNKKKTTNKNNEKINPGYGHKEELCHFSCRY